LPRIRVSFKKMSRKQLDFCSRSQQFFLNVWTNFTLFFESSNISMVKMSPSPLNHTVYSEASSLFSSIVLTKCHKQTSDFKRTKRLKRPVNGNA
ncbi:mCG145185, partial [Mus musculus]